MGIDITTNNTPRALVDWEELTDAERAGFDWTDGDAGESFFRYKGQVYALSEFMRAGDAFPGWHGYHGDSYFSGVLVRLPDGDSDSVIVARYCA